MDHTAVEGSALDTALLERAGVNGSAQDTIPLDTTAVNGSAQDFKIKQLKAGGC
jgi:hypothetical protein